MWTRKCLSVTLVILINASLVKNLLADFQDDVNQSKVVDFLKNVQERNFSSLNFRREGQRNFSNPCSAHIYEFIDSLLKKEMWTFKMIDAASKIPSGLLMGLAYDFGMYDECIAIREKKNGIEIRGRHCMYNIGLKLNSSELNKLEPRLSVCVPSNCNSSDVTQLLELIILKMTNISGIGINSVEATCSGIDPIKWSTGSIVALSLIGSIILFLLVCTFLDFLQIQLNIENNSLKTLSKFSMQRSALQILNTKVNSGSVTSINGIRFLSICWIILGHAYIKRGKSASIVNRLDAFEWSNRGNSLYVTLSVFAVDSFFTLSGFLMSYVFIKEMSKGGKFNLFSYYLHRYIRLTPAVGFLLILMIFVLPHFGSGPLWDGYWNQNENKCADKWWSMILYLQNFVQTDIKGTAFLGWICAFISFGFCTLGMGIILRKDYEYNVIWETILATLARSMWGFGLSWIIFASIKGRGGAVTEFLSLSMFLPLAKLSYCMYLVHEVIQDVLSKSDRVNTYFSDFTMFMNFLNDVILSIVVAFFFSLFFESPMLILEKIISSTMKIEARNDFRQDGHNKKVKTAV